MGKQNTKMCKQDNQKTTKNLIDTWFQFTILLDIFKVRYQVFYS